MAKNNNICERVFTDTPEGVNLEVNKLTVGCIASKKNNFNLDEDGNLTVNTITAKEQNLSGDGSSRDEIINIVYPVGSIYLSVNNVNPGTIFGGTWERVPDGYLRSRSSGTGLQTGGSMNTGNATGNTASTTPGNVGGTALTVAQMPSHVHRSRSMITGGTAGNLSHTFANRLTVNTDNGVGNGLNTASTGGSATHTHTSAAHTHGLNAHNHSIDPSWVTIFAWRRTA